MFNTYNMGVGMCLVVAAADADRALAVLRENGEDASKYPDVKVPDSQKKYVTVNKVSVADAKKGNIVWMGRIGARHYQIAGPEGAVVTEYGAYHSNDNNRYTNPSVGF